MVKVMRSKLISILVVAFLAIAVVVNARGINYGVVTSATGAVAAGPGYLKGVVFATDQASSCTFDLYDYATNNNFSTTTEFKLIPQRFASTSDRLNYWAVDFPDGGLHFFAGIYAVISSTGEMQIYWSFE